MTETVHQARMMCVEWAGDDAMSEPRVFQITLPFGVPAGDTEGIFIEALLDATLQYAPENAYGVVAGANIAKGNVDITFTLEDVDADEAKSVADDLLARVKAAVLTGDDACISAA